MKLTKLAMIAVIGLLLPDGSARGQYGGSSGAKFSHEQEAILAHYGKLHEETRNQIDEVLNALGGRGDGTPGNHPGIARLNELTKRITEKKEELDESNRLISRAESKQKVIRSKIVRIEQELSKSLNQMPHDPVARALQRLVEIDEMASERMKKKFEAGQISSDELSNTERKLAESRLQLARHQWDESADSRKEFAVAKSALEEAVFETEMQVSERAQLEMEIESLKFERIRIESFLREESELSRRATEIEQMLSIIRSGNTALQDQMAERLRKMGVKPYVPAKPASKPNDPQSGPDK